MNIFYCFLLSSSFFLNCKSTDFVILLIPSRFTEISLYTYIFYRQSSKVDFFLLHLLSLKLLKKAFMKIYICLDRNIERLLRLFLAEHSKSHHYICRRLNFKFIKEKQISMCHAKMKSIIEPLKYKISNRKYIKQNIQNKMES